MRHNIGSIDGLTRALGGTPLLIGATLALPGVDARTLETFALWVTLLVGVIALGAAFAGHCSWYAGVFMTGAAFLIFSFREVPFPLVQTLAALNGMGVAAVGLFTRARRYCPVNAVFRVSTPAR